MLLATALTCLAMNIYHESRGENIAGQYAVALVTMNRAGHDRSQVCKQVLRRKQFSWTNTLVCNKRLVAAGTPKDARAWKTALIIARTVLNGLPGDFTNGSTHYHTLAVTPRWRKSMLATKVIGQHIFYRSV